MMMNYRSTIDCRALCASALWLMPLALGCGDRLGDVAGKVTYADGAPLVGARVVARAEATGKSVEGITDKEGRYSLTTVEEGRGLPPGDYKATILENRGRGDNMRPPTIASKFSNGDQSGLAFTVAAGESKAFDITVTPP